MAGGREYTNHQRKIINRYYEHQDTIITHRLGEIVSEMALAAGDEKKLARLWKRADQALAKSGLGAGEAARIVETRDVEALAKAVARMS